MPHSPIIPCQEETQRPQSAHPSLAPHSPYQGDINHLTPSYHNEVRRSSLSGPCQITTPSSPAPPQYGGPPSPAPPQYLSPDSYRSSDSYAEQVQHQVNPGDQGEHSSEVWQDIVRQLAVS